MIAELARACRTKARVTARTNQRMESEVEQRTADLKETYAQLEQLDQAKTDLVLADHLVEMEGALFREGPMNLQTQLFQFQMGILTLCRISSTR